MKILVTGSEGSLMRWVIPVWLDDGHEVLGVDRADGAGARYAFQQGDLRDAAFVRRVMTGCDAVVHAAAQVYGVLGFHRRSAEILVGDLGAHVNLVEAARANDVRRFVYLSSSVVYERFAERRAVTEDDAEHLPLPASGYGISKVVGERLCRSLAETGMEYTIWRPFNLVNPYEIAGPTPGVAHVYADFIRKLLVQRQNPLDILGDGEQVRSFTWVNDAARAIAAHSFAEVSANRVFNLGNPAETTIRDLARMVRAKGVERGWLNPAALRFRHLPVPDTDVRYRKPDIAQVRDALGWEPETDLSASLDRCIDHLNHAR